VEERLGESLSQQPLATLPEGKSTDASPIKDGAGKGVRERTGIGGAPGSVRSTKRTRDERRGGVNFLLGRRLSGVRVVSTESKNSLLTKRGIRQEEGEGRWRTVRQGSLPVMGEGERGA